MTTPSGKGAATRHVQRRPSAARPSAARSSAAVPPTKKPGQGEAPAEKTVSAPRPLGCPGASRRRRRSPFGGSALPPGDGRTAVLGSRRCGSRRRCCGMRRDGGGLLRIGLGKSQVRRRRGQALRRSSVAREHPFPCDDAGVSQPRVSGRQLVDDLGIEGMNGERCALPDVAQGSLAPTNFFMGNPRPSSGPSTPTAQRPQGLATWPATFGTTTACRRCRPHAVQAREKHRRDARCGIFRNEVLEADAVHAGKRRHLTAGPCRGASEVNKYYALDLAPAAACTNTCSSRASLCTDQLAHPTGEQRRLDLSTPYVQATIDASTWSARFPGSPDVTPVGRWPGRE